jgi:TetR/AcrR family transcriptional repressor of uid operon
VPKLTEDQQTFRRNRILDAAETCFATAGFHKTTTQDICKAAGISAGALYLYFESKEALIAGLSERDRAEIIQKFEALAEATDFASGLQKVMRSVIVEQPPHKSRLYLEIGAEATRSPAVRKLVSECDGAIRGVLVDILNRAAAQGRIAPAIPTERIAEIMAIIADGLFWRRAVNPDFDLESVSDDILRLLGALVGDPDAFPPKTSQAAR